MAESGYRSQGGKPGAALAGVVLPVAVLLIIIAVVSGLVLGGVIQGDAERVSVEPPADTEATIIIGP